MNDYDNPTGNSSAWQLLVTVVSYATCLYETVVVLMPHILLLYTDIVQWNLRIMDTLGPGILSFIERLSSLRRLKMYWYNRKVELLGPKVCPLYI